MGSMRTLKASDGHELAAYEAIPEGTQRGSLVVIQEIFGVNVHIREVCDKFAGEGYSSIAPAVFDRVEPGVELGYTPEDIERGRNFMGQLSWRNTMMDVEAAADALAGDKRPGIVGYCYGGTVTWVAACRLDLTCAVGYYGGGIIDFVDESPKCPTMLHFGEQDAGIPMSDVKEISGKHPEITVHTYAEAEHGFNCDRRASYHETDAKLALERTNAFLFQQFL